MKHLKQQSGFTIVSVMIALVLLTLGIMAVSRTSFEVMRAHTATASRTTALEIGRSYLEELRTRDPASLVSETAVTVDETGQVSATGAYQRSVLVEVLAKNLKRVTVRVRGPHLKGPIELVTNTFVSGT